MWYRESLLNEALRAGESHPQRYAPLVILFAFPLALIRSSWLLVCYWLHPPVVIHFHNRRCCHDSLTATDDRGYAAARPLTPHAARLPPRHPTIRAVLRQITRSDQR